ncbi:MAG TPA: DNA internalization-related competence protein ComEC/Rec2 [Methylophaga aminisulfidivorans]|uniref:DNA internalization-related competence protein ComEC/Rec2 n=1 Tax=Methylophaga aminisulfidivorans TaxID=230105 RepID=A0A7C1VX97_9GAMM|nr:DNA internalization-related competence protein ComEC/Rec2 [Methylophaga aminisulfidivorans]
MNKSAIAFLLGCLLCLQLYNMQMIIWPAFVGILLTLWFKKYSLLAFSIGLFWAATFSYVQLSDRFAADKQTKQWNIQGQISSIPERDGQVLKFIFTPFTNHLPSKIRLSWYYPPDEIPHAGEIWALTVKLRRPRGMSNPGGFDYEKWLFIEQIGATGYVKKSPHNQKLQESSHWNIHHWREHIQQQINSHLSTSPERNLILGLSIGLRDHITNEQWEILRNTGTSHLLAISGLHIGLAAAIGFFLFRFGWRYIGIEQTTISAHQLAAIAGGLFALFYACLAGLSIPTQRAVIMVFAVMFALFIKRPLFPANLLALSAVLILLINPLAILTAGFWLSFAAVCLIMLTCSQRYPAYRYPWLRIHLLIAIGLIPLLLVFFNQVSVISPIANLIAVPVVSILIVPLILLGMVLLPISTQLAQFVLSSSDLLLSWLWQLLTFLSNLPLSNLTIPTLTLTQTVGLSVIVFLLLIPRGFPHKRLGLLLILPLFFSSTNRPNPGEFYLSMLDVGQGLAVVIETHSHVLVYDTGPRFNDSFNTGDAVVAPYLNSRHRDHIDKIIISHTDNDHIGGLGGLTKNLSYAELLSNDDINNFDNNHCQAGQQWLWDEVSFKILAPFSESFGSRNNRSCVLSIKGKSRSALLPGDIERNTEQALVSRYGSSLKSDILAVPHHGSKTSSSNVFLNAVNPRYSLFSVGYRNRYHFPNTVIFKRYQDKDIVTYRTDHDGAILFTDKDRPTLWRQQSSKFWTDKTTE